MQNRSNYLLAGTILILFGFIYLLNLIGLFDINVTLVFAYSCICYGLGSYYINFDKNKKAMLFTSVIIFMIGILFLTTQYFYFYDTRDFIIPSFMFITGTGFIVLFIDDLASRVFLYTSIILILSSILYIWTAKKFAFIVFTNNIADIIIKYYPVLLILIGINLLFNKRKQ